MLGMLLGAGLLGCDTPLGPAVALTRPPTLASLVLDEYSLRDGGVFAISSVATDTAFRLPRGTYLSVELVTSRGDEEELRLGRLMCGEVTCHRATVFMKEGARILDIESQIRLAGGRLSIVNPLSAPRWGAVWVLDGRVSRFRDLLTVHRDVEQIGFEVPFSTEPVDPGQWSGLLSGGLALSTMPIVSRDGTLSIAVGDTVRARYTDAEGALLERSWVLLALRP